MAMKIWSTSVSDGKIKLIISDDKNRDSATTWIEVSLPLAIDELRSLAVIQAIALRDLRNLIDKEIQNFRDLPASKTGTMTATDRHFLLLAP